jgi:hypothetical protein
MACGAEGEKPGGTRPGGAKAESPPVNGKKWVSVLNLRQQFADHQARIGFSGKPAP